jgi:nucleotide sugar dehydrogenase
VIIKKPLRGVGRMQVGIIGQGFVGSAIREGLKKFYRLYTYDIDASKCNSTHKEVCQKSEIIFVCVPTPMMKTGKCDTRLLEQVIQKIQLTCDELGTMPTLVIKSTVPPGTTERLRKNGKLDVCFSPEFLTEANSFDDFKNQTRIIIGGYGAKKVKRMFRKLFPEIPIIITKPETAEMVKYFTNCFLSTKVMFANQMFEICRVSEIDYDKVCEYVLHDLRIGNSHLSVPGPDGDRGFGGHCFPKDLAATIHYSKELGFSPLILEAVEQENLKIRENKDWLNMVGRAVSSEEG